MELTLDPNTRILPLTNEIRYVQAGQWKVLKIEPLTMKLLEYLLQHKGSVCTKDELIANIWQGNQEVGKPALRKNIYKLRSVLAETGMQHIIHTIPKEGYRLEDDGSSHKRMRFKKNKLPYLVAILIVALVILKIVFPGIIHRLLH